MLLNPGSASPAAPEAHVCRLGPTRVFLRNRASCRVETPRPLDPPRPPSPVACRSPASPGLAGVC